MKIYIRLFALIPLVFLLLSDSVSAQDKAESTFKQNCASCHSIGKGRLVGPDLSNVHQRRAESWLLNFIKSSQSVIKSGDQTADSIFKAYNQIVMPDQTALSDGEIRDILTYIKTKSSNSLVSSPAVAAEQTKQTTVNKKAVLFDSTQLILLAVLLSLLLVILSLYRKIKNLSEELMDYYSSERSFFK
ncbi:MAG: cytochrome c [Pedobacter sp.]|jgi:mono/diheme cytochrome c family protein